MILRLLLLSLGTLLVQASPQITSITASSGCTTAGNGLTNCPPFSTQIALTINGSGFGNSGAKAGEICADRLVTHTVGKETTQLVCVLSQAPVNTAFVVRVITSIGEYSNGVEVRYGSSGSPTPSDGSSYNLVPLLSSIQSSSNDPLVCSPTTDGGLANCPTDRSDITLTFLGFNFGSNSVTVHAPDLCTTNLFHLPGSEDTKLTCLLKRYPNPPTNEPTFSFNVKLVFPNGISSNPRLVSYANALTLTCQDGLQNGDEIGVDCGGSCGVACQSLPTPTPTPVGGLYSCASVTAMDSATAQYSGVYFLLSNGVDITPVYTRLAQTNAFISQTAAGAWTLSTGLGQPLFTTAAGATLAGPWVGLEVNPGMKGPTGECLVGVTPRCVDGLQNGNEEGVDCGGDCEILCGGASNNPVIESISASPCTLRLNDLVNCPLDPANSHVTLTITGRGFGATGGVVPLVCASALVHKPSSPSTELTCQLASGTPLNRVPVVFTNEMGFSTAPFRHAIIYEDSAPSCFDGRKNGDEQGLDCGGTGQGCVICVGPIPVISSLAAPSGGCIAAGADLVQCLPSGEGVIITIYGSNFGASGASVPSICRSPPLHAPATPSTVLSCQLKAASEGVEVSVVVATQGGTSLARSLKYKPYTGTGSTPLPTPTPSGPLPPILVDPGVPLLFSVRASADCVPDDGGGLSACPVGRSDIILTFTGQYFGASGSSVAWVCASETRHTPGKEDTEITCPLNPGAAGALYNVIVITTLGASNPVMLRYVPDSPDAITNFLPGAPFLTGILLSADGLSVQVNFAAPSIRTSEIQGYVVQVIPAGADALQFRHASVLGSNSPLDVTGLIAGVTYRFTVAALVANPDPLKIETLEGPPSFLSKAVVAGGGSVGYGSIPDVPIMGFASATGYNAAYVFFSLPLNTVGGRLLVNVDNWVVRAKADGQSQAFAVGPVSPVLVYNLAASAVYSFQVAANNTFGMSAWSEWSNGVTISPVVIPALPNAPLIESVKAFDSYAVVRIRHYSWQIIDGYSVFSHPVTSIGNNRVSPDGLFTDIFVRALNNGVAYSFTAYATNSGGRSLPSSPSYPFVTPTGPLPSKPFITKVWAGDAGCTVEFQAPTSPGNSDILFYRVQAFPGGLTVEGPGSPLSVVNGMVNGVTYTLTVSAINKQGSGPASLASSSVTPTQLKPYPPVISDVHTNFDKRSVEVSFTPFSVSSGVEYYSLRASPGGQTVTGVVSPLTMKNLKDGIAHTFTLSASNSYGESVVSPHTRAFMFLFPPPDAPLISAVWAGNQAISVSFAAAVRSQNPRHSFDTNLQNDVIIFYTATAIFNSVALVSVTGSASPLTINGLTNGLLYQIIVSASNKRGTGANSLVSEALTPLAARSLPPTNVYATVDAYGDVIVSWTAPAFAEVTAYTIMSYPASNAQTSVVLSSPFTVKGLNRFVKYTFSVVARTSAGLSAASSHSNYVWTEPTVPSAPVIVDAWAGQTDVTVSFEMPEGAYAGSSPVSHYVIRTVPVEEGGPFVWVTGYSSPITLTGLTPSTRYRLQVLAGNSQGLGLPSLPWQDDVIPSGNLPGTPLFRHIELDLTGKVSLEFSPPEVINSANQAITLYKVSSTPSGLTAEGISSPIVVPGSLDFNVPYTFSVVAVNVAGHGAASDASPPVVRRGFLPSAPSLINSWSGFAAATLIWTAPTSSGDSYVIDYRVRLHYSLSKADEFTEISVSTTTVTVPSLANDEGFYTFSVAARNSRGVGPFSALSRPLRPSSLYPIAPTMLSAKLQSDVPTTFGNLKVGTTAVVDFLPLVAGAGVVEYVVISHPHAYIARGVSSPISLEALQPGVTYTFTVYAVSNEGRGAASVQSNSVMIMKYLPSAPQHVRVVPGQSDLSLLFDPPADIPIGTLITGYEVLLFGSLPLNQPFATLQAPSSPITLTQLLRPNVKYSFYIRAICQYGRGQDSPPTAMASLNPLLPATPVMNSAVLKDGVVTVSFTMPLLTTVMDSLRGFVVYSSDGILQGEGTASPILIRNLDDDTPYQYYVQARNAFGLSACSALSAVIIAVGLNPGKVVVLDAWPGPASASVSFLPPAHTGATKIFQYILQAELVLAEGETSSPIGSEGSQVDYLAITGSRSPLTLGSLQNGREYRFRVAAKNGNGVGPWSDVTWVVVPSPLLPVAPFLMGVRISNSGEALVFFNSTEEDVSYFTARSSPAGLVGSGISSPLTVDLLEPNVDYSFFVVARNSAGSGAASNPSEPQHWTARQPSAPILLRVWAGAEAVSVEYQPPYDQGQSPVLHYVVTLVGGGGNNITFSSTLNPITVRRLQNNVAYTVTLRAVNDLGEGAEAVAEQTVTPLSFLPAPPLLTDVIINHQAGTATVSFVHSPALDALYRVYSHPSGHSATGPLSPLTVRGLVPGISYVFFATADHFAGEGASSLPSALYRVRPVAPGPPTKVVGFAGNGMASVTFEPPVELGAYSEPLSYTVTSQPAGGHAIGTRSPIAVSGLNNGLAYTFIVTAFNGRAEGVGSTPTGLVTPTSELPGQPKLNYAWLSGEGAMVSFTAPSPYMSLEPVLFYRVTSFPPGLNAVGSATPIFVPGLSAHPGVEFSFSVTAFNAMGSSAFSLPSNVVSYTPVNGAKLSLDKVMAGNTAISVHFTDAAEKEELIIKSAGGDENSKVKVKMYTALATPAGNAEFDMEGSVKIEGAFSPLILDGLQNGVAYVISLYMDSETGPGAIRTYPVPVTPLSSLPMAPTLLDAVLLLGNDAAAGQNTASVAFTELDDPANLVYVATSSPPGFAEVSASSPIRVKNITPGITFTFSVAAFHHDVGFGASSQPSLPLHFYTSPGEPTIVAAWAGNGAVTIQYEENEEHGLSDVFSIRVVATPPAESGEPAVVLEGSLHNPVSITGLTNEVVYKLTVVTINQQGLSPPSHAILATPSAQLPFAPFMGEVVVDRVNFDSVFVYFSPPPLTRGTAVRFYTVYVFPGMRAVKGPLSPVVISSLEKGIEYTFVVSVTLLSGAQGAVSEPSNPVLIKSRLPLPVPIEQVVVGNQEVSIVFDSGPVLGSQDRVGKQAMFTVTVFPGERYVSGASSPLLVSGLTNGKNYTFALSASNDLGAGPSSYFATKSSPMNNRPRAPVIDALYFAMAPLQGPEAQAVGTITIEFSQPFLPAAIAAAGQSIATSTSATPLVFTAFSSPMGLRASAVESPLVIMNVPVATWFEFVVQASAPTTGLYSAFSSPSSPISSLEPGDGSSMRHAAPVNVRTQIVAGVNGELLLYFEIAEDTNQNMTVGSPPLVYSVFSARTGQRLAAGTSIPVRVSALPLYQPVSFVVTVQEGCCQESKMSKASLPVSLNLTSNVLPSPQSARVLMHLDQAFPSSSVEASPSYLYPALERDLVGAWTGALPSSGTFLVLHVARAVEGGMDVFVDVIGSENNDPYHILRSFQIQAMQPSSPLRKGIYTQSISAQHPFLGACEDGLSYTESCSLLYTSSPLVPVSGGGSSFNEAVGIPLIILLILCLIAAAWLTAYAYFGQHWCFQEELTEVEWETVKPVCAVIGQTPVTMLRPTTAAQSGSASTNALSNRESAAVHASEVDVLLSARPGNIKNFQDMNGGRQRVEEQSAQQVYNEHMIRSTTTTSSQQAQQMVRQFQQ